MFIQHKYSLLQALSNGSIYQERGSFNKEELIKKTLERVAPILRADSDVISGLLLEREELMETGLNNGIAVPHTREHLHNGGEDVICLVHLEKPTRWGSLDGKDVHTLFFLFAISNKHHLQLLARIAHIATCKEFIDLVSSGSISDEVLLEYVQEWERNQRILTN